MRPRERQVRGHPPTAEELRIEYIRRERDTRTLEHLRSIRERGLARARERMMGYRY